MHKTIIRKSVAVIIARSAALTFFAAAATLGLNAQQSAGTTRSLPPISLKSSLVAPLDLSSSSSTDSLSYSSSTGAAETATAESFNFTGREDQPPPRRRYGRPNYHDSRTNADGSSKYTFAIGGGLTVAAGNSHRYLDTSYDLQGGIGRNFSKTFGVIAQFDYARFGFRSPTLANQQAIYESIDTVDSFVGLDGYSHIWSFSINPIINFYTSDTLGAYVIGGVGFYHKTANFTLPAIGQYCDPYYGCYQYAAYQSIDKYTSNAPGFSGGLGFTYRTSRFSSAKLYTEARYVWIDNQPRPFSEGSATSTYFNVFPQNSQRTGYIPITVGVRW